MARLPIHLTYAHEGRAFTLCTQVSPRAALLAGGALLVARGLQRLVSLMSGDSRDLEMLGAEEVVALPRHRPRVQLGGGLDLLGAD